MSQAQEQRFFRNNSLSIDVLAAMILIFFTLTQIIGCDKADNPAQPDATVAERTAPEGQVRITGQTTDTSAVSAPAVAATADATPAAASPAPAEAVAAGGDETGKRVYNSLCFTCHGNLDGSGGLPNMPHFGDKAAWADRIAQGMPLLYEHALKGFTGASGMPMLPKGGNPNLTDDEVRATVDFMVTSSQ
ncbi:MAG: cytochrome c5 family protein [Gammaproteobacteria bacterium]|nr:cytochrome c5 family protein [Gammaproteobacteria bacterium]